MGDIAGKSDASQRQTIENRQVAIQGQGNYGFSGNVGGNISVISADPEVAKDAIRLAEGVSNGSYQAVIHTLGVLEAVQQRSADSVDRAVSSAQQTALNATPIPVADYAGALAAQDSDFKTKALYAGIAIVVIAGVVYVTKTKSA